MKPNLKQYIIVTGPLMKRGGVGYRGLMVNAPRPPPPPPPPPEKGGGGGPGGFGPPPPPPPLFQKSNFAANVFLQIRFCVILQGI